MGVPGCGESSIANPVVKIWPLEMVKLRAAARVTRLAIQALMSNFAIATSYARVSDLGLRKVDSLSRSR